MRVFTSLPSSSLNFSHAIAFGMFDGVHLGHKIILEEVKKFPHHSVITYKKHPSHLFHPSNPTPLITPLETRLDLFDQLGIQSVYVLEFDRHFAEQSYETFLHRLKELFLLSHLIRGEGDAFGKDREGDAGAISQFANRQNIDVIYLTKMIQDGHPISSSRIRSLIKQGDLTTVAQLLGRPYSVTLSKKVSLEELILPPPGYYKVTLQTPFEKNSTEVLIKDNALIFDSPNFEEVEVIW